jgi:hypothetical protein
MQTFSRNHFLASFRFPFADIVVISPQKLPYSDIFKRYPFVTAIQLKGGDDRIVEIVSYTEIQCRHMELIIH